MPFTINGTPTPSGSASPNPAYTGVFIPQEWSKALAKSLYDLTLIGRLTNSHWNTELNKQPGDTFHIPLTPRVTVAAYEANMSISGASAQRPSAADNALPMDKGWFFNTVIDDVMRTQAAPTLLDIFGKQGALELKYELEKYLLNTVMVASIAAANAGATAGAGTTSVNLGVTGTPIKPYASPAGGQISTVDFLTRLSQVLDEAKVPNEDRWVVVPPWLAKEIGDDDVTVAHQDMSTDQYGRIGRIARLDVYQSASLTTNLAGETVVIAGHPDALVYGTQISKTEEFRSPTIFSTYIRGLLVCGGKTVNNTLLAKAVVAR